MRTLRNILAAGAVVLGALAIAPADAQAHGGYYGGYGYGYYRPAPVYYYRPPPPPPPAYYGYGYRPHYRPWHHHHWGYRNW